jgi:hypothetical protein
VKRFSAVHDSVKGNNMAIAVDLEKEIARKSDDELFHILRHDKDYMPNVIEIVRAEIQCRNLGKDKTEELESQAQVKVAEEIARAKMPLSWTMRIFIFLFSNSFIFSIAVFAVIAENYRNKGYIQKCDDARRFSIYGMLFALLAGIAFWLKALIMH